MSKKTTQAAGATFPFFSVCFLILMTLKLTGYIAWSWWMLFAVLFAPLIILVFIGGVCLIGWGLMTLAMVFLAWMMDRKRTREMKNRRGGWK